MLLNSTPSSLLHLVDNLKRPAGICYEYEEWAAKTLNRRDGKEKGEEEEDDQQTNLSEQ